MMSFDFSSSKPEPVTTDSFCLELWESSKISVTGFPIAYSFSTDFCHESNICMQAGQKQASFTWFKLELCLAVSFSTLLVK